MKLIAIVLTVFSTVCLAERYEDPSLGTSRGGYTGGYGRRHDPSLGTSRGDSAGGYGEYEHPSYGTSNPVGYRRKKSGRYSRIAPVTPIFQTPKGALMKGVKVKTIEGATIFSGSKALAVCASGMEFHVEDHTLYSSDGRHFSEWVKVAFVTTVGSTATPLQYGWISKSQLEEI